MVKAVLTPAKVKMVEKVIEPGKVTLELTPEEAGMLWSILGRFVAGGPTSLVYNALCRLDITQPLAKIKDDEGRNPMFLKWEETDDAAW
jgi:hypothetical protein